MNPTFRQRFIHRLLVVLGMRSPAPERSTQAQPARGTILQKPQRVGLTEAVRRDRASMDYGRSWPEVASTEQRTAVYVPPHVVEPCARLVGISLAVGEPVRCEVERADWSCSTDYGSSDSSYPSDSGSSCDSGSSGSD